METAILGPSYGEYYLAHRDVASRRILLPESDLVERYLSSTDGRLLELKVQYNDYRNIPVSSEMCASWQRTPVQFKPPLTVEFVAWAFESCPQALKNILGTDVPAIASVGSEVRNGVRRYRIGTTGIKDREPLLTRINQFFREKTSKPWLFLYMRWPYTSLIVSSMALFNFEDQGILRNNGYYDPVLYKYWGYPRISRNKLESVSTVDLESGDNGSTSNHESDGNESPDSVQTTLLQPRHLCILRDGGLTGTPAFEVINVDLWKEQNPGEQTLEYIFVSYTRKQFQIYSINDMDTWEISQQEKEDRSRLREQDVQDLLRMAENAARRAGVPAFWIDFLCMSGNTLQQDVFRICDVVKGAHSMIIILGNSIENKLASAPLQSFGSLLRVWGRRIWTFPEAMLCSSEYRIAVYVQGSAENPVRNLAKRNFAVLAWEDASEAKQLIDHYDGSNILSSLELTTIALKCLQRRLTWMESEGQRPWARGDMSYALMGLKKRRPAIVLSDTDFEAFGRLSMVNDSKVLLERLICLLPPYPNLPWHDIRDSWGVQLWDIEPTCQVAGIADDQTLIIDGAFGATIVWDSIPRLASMKPRTWRTTLAEICLRGSFPALIFGIILTLTQQSHDSKPIISAIVGIVVTCLALVGVFSTPYLLISLGRDKLQGSREFQAHFIGIEGMVDLGDVEKSLLGYKTGLLRWSVAGSPLSRHHPDQDGDCEELPPITEIHDGSPGESEAVNHQGEKIFTLIDTYTMTATAFWALRPPTVVMVCGAEGGMQRAVLCAYNWKTQAFERQTVVRLKTVVLSKMFRVDRFRFRIGDSGHKKELLEQFPHVDLSEKWIYTGRQY